VFVFKVTEPSSIPYRWREFSTAFSKYTTDIYSLETQYQVSTSKYRGFRQRGLSREGAVVVGSGKGNAGAR